jgi:DNA (cytosine-5)-methyltransferase 1
VEYNDLKTLRERTGLSQAEFAAKTGYSVKTIQRWECGQGTPRKAVMVYLRGPASRPKSEWPDGPASFRFVDLFAGIGGLRAGFESIGGRCVFTSEWDKYAQITYRANFGAEHPIAGDILQIPSEHIPPHEVLLAGFPCQPFSIAGVSKKNALGRPHGFACETQGTLFFEVARILKHHTPPAFLLENVKNLATHDGGRTFRTIMMVLRDELGYHVHAKVLDARGVVPQHRERIFIVGFRDHADFSWDDVELPDAEHGPRLRSILHPENGPQSAEPPYTDARGRVSRRYVLTDHLWTYLQAYAAKHRRKGNGFGFGLVGADDVARTLSARYYKDGSEILIRRRRGTPRRLTPRECARLMGFDRPGRTDFQIPVSDTQAYKQFGNSVVVPVVEAVARAMRALITGEQFQSRREQLVLELAG